MLEDVGTDEVDGFLIDRGFQVLLTAYSEAQKVLDYQGLELARFEPALIRWPHSIALPEDIIMPLLPRCVTHFRHHGLHFSAVAIETVVQIQRTEVVTVASQLRKQSDGPLRPVARLGCHQFANGVRQRCGPVPQVVIATEGSRARNGNGRDQSPPCSSRGISSRSRYKRLSP